MGLTEVVYIASCPWNVGVFTLVQYACGVVTLEWHETICEFSLTLKIYKIKIKIKMEEVGWLSSWNCQKILNPRRMQLYQLGRHPKQSNFKMIGCVNILNYGRAMSNQQQ